MTEEVKSDAESQNINNSQDSESQTTKSDNALSDDMVELATKDERVWEKLMSHDRIKQLRDKAKQAEKLEKQMQEQEKRKLEEEKKWEELYQKEKETNQTLQENLKRSAIDSKIQSEAMRLGLVDADAALALIDRSNIDFADGSVNGVKEAIEALVESKPYLAGKTNQKAIGTASNSTDSGTQKRFKHSEIQNPDFYAKHEKEILEAMKLGLVEDDI